MRGYTRQQNSTIGAELIELACIFLLAMLIGWTVSTSTEGAEVWQENNTEGVGRP